MVMEGTTANFARAPGLYNQICERVCSEMNVTFISLENELAEQSHQHIPGYHEFSDDVHLNEAGARLMAKLYEKHLRPILHFIKKNR
jgi:lysophospholipase L1-like esterase